MVPIAPGQPYQHGPLASTRVTLAATWLNKVKGPGCLHREVSTWSNSMGTRAPQQQFCRRQGWARQMALSRPWKQQPLPSRCRHMHFIRSDQKLQVASNQKTCIESPVLPVAFGHQA